MQLPLLRSLKILRADMTSTFPCLWTLSCGFHFHLKNSYQHVLAPEAVKGKAVEETFLVCGPILWKALADLQTGCQNSCAFSGVLAVTRNWTWFLSGSPNKFRLWYGQFGRHIVNYWPCHGKVLASARCRHGSELPTLPLRSACSAVIQQLVT